MGQQVNVYRELDFYYGGTKKIVFDTDTSSTILYILPKTDATEYVAFGNGTLNMDVKFFGNAAAQYMLWDESANELVFATSTSIDITADKTMIDFKAGDASSIDPSATAETGWININVDGTKRYVPFYAAS